MVHYPSVPEGIACAQEIYTIVKSGEGLNKKAEIVEHAWNVLGVVGLVTMGDPHLIGASPDIAAITFDCASPDFFEQIEVQLSIALPMEVAGAEAGEPKAIPWLLLGKIALALLQKFLLS